jgi:outer membrane protein OmpA-like peptidoglycan-associated protein
MASAAITYGLLAGCIAVPAIMEVAWLNNASESLEAAPSEAQNVAIASASEDNYCTPKLKQVLRRVAGACGLLGEGGRGCKPTDAKSVAALSGEDFNALFKPLSHRAGIIQFDSESTELDFGGSKVIDDSWSDQRGASFYFVVARASRDGDPEVNQRLSQSRAEAVLKHLETKFPDTELRSQVGLLWLGEEYAQLSEEFCSWKRSREGECSIKDINRSAFVAWIDCAI